MVHRALQVAKLTYELDLQWVKLPNNNLYGQQASVAGGRGA